MDSVVITVRVPRDLKDKIGRYGISVSKVVRRALEEEVERRRLDEARKAADRIGELFARIPEKEIVESIREMRGAR